MMLVLIPMFVIMCMFILRQFHADVGVHLPIHNEQCQPSPWYALAMPPTCEEQIDPDPLLHALLTWTGTSLLAWFL